MKLSEEAIKLIRSTEHLKLRNRLALELNKSQYMIVRYIDSNDPMLTTATALQIIREETGLTDNKILTKEKEEA